MGAGYSRINSLTIMQTSQGLAEYLLKTNLHAPSRGVVIGHDARHNSEKFAKLTAAAFMAKGFKILWYEDLAHTPLVPYAVLRFEAAAGIMITASHNPAQDNGYKVYGSTGCQINSPLDKEIAAFILENLEPISWHFDESSSFLQPMLLAARLGYKKLVANYLQIKNHRAAPAFVYTPMHGVGLKYMMDMFVANFAQESANSQEHRLCPEMTLVTEQSAPDPDFSTVKYPNPEEDGALDLAKQTADRKGICLIIANDPDADRFAAAEKVNDVWYQFTGDQMGVLLAYQILTQLKTPATKKDVMLLSAVSSKMLWNIGKSEGFTVIETLTGFKWLGNKARNLGKQGFKVHFGYEEALGYMFPTISYDKDGIVAAGVFIKACTVWGSPYTKLQELYQKYGYFETMNTYWRSSDVAATKSVFEKIRSFDLSGFLPHFKVERKRDLSTGFDSSETEQEAVLPSSPSTQMITYWLAPDLSTDGECGGAKFTIRASGTEPKIKIYLESWDSNPDRARKGAAKILRTLKEAWFNDEAFTIEKKYRDI